MWPSPQNLVIIRARVQTSARGALFFQDQAQKTIVTDQRIPTTVLVCSRNRWVGSTSDLMISQSSVV